MELEALAAIVRSTITAHPRSVSSGYPDEVKEAARNYASAGRAAGENWSRLASRVPLSTTTLRDWTLTPKHTALIPVVITPPPQQHTSPPRPVIVTPGGYRLEGLSLMDALLALRELP
jgi:hypothetical protein